MFVCAALSNCRPLHNFASRIFALQSYDVFFHLRKINFNYLQNCEEENEMREMRKKEERKRVEHVAADKRVVRTKIE